METADLSGQHPGTRVRLMSSVGSQSYIKVTCPGCGDRWDAVVDEFTDIAVHCDCGERVEVDTGVVLIVTKERRGSRRWICSHCGASQSAAPLANAEDLCTICGKRGMVSSWRGFLVIWNERKEREKEVEFIEDSDEPSRSPMWA